MKNKKYYTLIIVPHSVDAPISIKVPVSLMQVIGVATLLIFSLLMIFGNEYFHMKNSMGELERLRTTVMTQREQLDYFAKETHELQERMRALEKIDTAIRDLLEFDSQAISLAARTVSVTGISRGSSPTTNLATSMLTDSLSYVKDTINNQQESLIDLKESVEEYNARMAATPSILPTMGRITSPFGWRRSPTNERYSEFHKGVDFANSIGAPIFATGKGRVVFASTRGAYGRLVIINHGYGITTLYAHMSRIGVKEGQEVEKGQVIGYIGTSGRATGPHVHYEVHKKGVPVNPRDYF